MRFLWFVLVLGGLFASCGGLDAEGMKWDSVGIRGAVSATSLDDPFLELELVGGLTLGSRKPWRLEADSGWFVQSRLDLSAGSLSGRSEDGFVGTIGPAFTLGNKSFPVFLDLGSSPTILSRYKFGRTNFGDPFQFTSHVGFLWEIGSHVVMGYRVQHMSNARISRHNPGLDLHAFGLSYKF